MPRLYNQKAVRLAQIFPSHRCSKPLDHADKHKHTQHTQRHTLSVNPERWSKRSSRSAHSPWEGCETVNCLHNLHSRSLALFSFLFFLSPFLISLSHLPDLSSQGVYRGGWKSFLFQHRPDNRGNTGTDLFGLVSLFSYSSVGILDCKCVLHIYLI